MKASVVATLAVALLLSGCSRGVDNKEAIRQGVVNHLTNRAGLDVNSMDVEITSVSFRGNEADATVSFRPKGSRDAGAGMQMQYTLERKGNQWVVKGRRDSGSSPHGGGAMPGAMPQGHPPMDEGQPAGKK